MKHLCVKKIGRQEKGFTLLEIMLVIAVIGILALVTVPKYQALTDHYRLESSAQIVVGQLRYAKQLALDQRKEIYLALDKTTTEVLDSGDQDYGGLQAFDNSVNFAVSEAESNGLMVEAGKAKGLPYVVYDPRGFVENLPGSGGSVNILLTSLQTGRSVTVVLETKTGNVTLQW